MSDIIRRLKKVGAIHTNSHFVYTSGKHGSVYINKDALYPHTRDASAVGRMIAQRFRSKRIDTVVGPALGGIILSQWTAYHLSRLVKRAVYGIYTEKTTDREQRFTRGYDSFVKGKRVLVVEDLTTTGGSVAKVVHAVRSSGGTVVAVCVMVNRDPVAVTEKTVGAPLVALGELALESFNPAMCPLCARGVKINTTLGHGKKHDSINHHAKP